MVRTESITKKEADKIEQLRRIDCLRRAASNRRWFLLRDSPFRVFVDTNGTPQWYRCPENKPNPLNKEKVSFREVFKNAPRNAQEELIWALNVFY